MPALPGKDDHKARRAVVNSVGAARAESLMFGSDDCGGNMMLIEWPVDLSFIVIGPDVGLLDREGASLLVDFSSGRADDSAGATQAMESKQTPKVN